MKICGWNIHHSEKFVYKANSGSPLIQLKFYHYPEYRQGVEVQRAPQDFKLKKKGENSFFVFRKKLRAKGIISLDRDVTVFPVIHVLNPKDDWGRISGFPDALREKYRESSKYWPIRSSAIDAPEHDWFSSDDLSFWLRSAWQYIRERIRYPENQEKRLGAEEALIRGIGDCDEFTDLFMTLARMRGIPCRRITGFFISNEGRHVERHAWAEVLSPKFGWSTVDMALNNIGAHTINYVVLKVEEFNPAISDYQARINHTSKVHYHWEIEEPDIEPIECE